MKGWRDSILSELEAGACPLTIVADPDALFADESLSAELARQGIDIVEYDDPVAFRYLYETKYRDTLEAHESTLLVLVRGDISDARKLPYDLLRIGRILSFSLADLFPELNHSVIAALDRAHLDSLFAAQLQHHPKVLGENATKDFVLLHVFETAPQLFKGDADLFTHLLRRHYRNSRVPAVLDERFVELLRHGGQFEQWPLAHIVPDRAAFLRFVRERWPLYLDRLFVEMHAAETSAGDASLAQPSHVDITIPGPAFLPFGHDDVRVFIDNYFTEGLLQPVEHEAADALARTWAVVGIERDIEGERRRRIRKLLARVAESLPAADAHSHEWLRTAWTYSELLARWYAEAPSSAEDMGSEVQALMVSTNAAFLEWLRPRFGCLRSHPPVPPVMVHHVPRLIARRLDSRELEKAALIVVDGLALHQWCELRPLLLQHQALRISEDAVFAWIPSLTSVSRQSLLCGKSPYAFGGSIHTTSNEPKLWQQFWGDCGYTPQQVGYCRGVGAPGSIGKVRELADDPRVKVLAVVVNVVDDIMHGSELGAAGMHGQVRHWGETGILQEMIGCLLSQGFGVFLASDHGSTEAVGMGTSREGVAAETRGERARVYADAGLREMVLTEFPDAIKWPGVGLPSDWLPLLAPYGRAFVTKGKTTVCHGGASVEEIIVPFVEISRR